MAICRTERIGINYPIWVREEHPIQDAVVVAVPYARFGVAVAYARQASFMV